MQQDGQQAPRCPLSTPRSWQYRYRFIRGSRHVILSSRQGEPTSRRILGASSPAGLAGDGETLPLVKTRPPCGIFGADRPELKRICLEVRSQEERRPRIVAKIRSVEEILARLQEQVDFH